MKVVKYLCITITWCFSVWYGALLLEANMDMNYGHYNELNFLTAPPDQTVTYDVPPRDQNGEYFVKANPKKCL